MQSMLERSHPPAEIVLAERWRAYRRHGDRHVRDQLVLAYCPLVKHVAGRIASKMPAHVDLADLVAYGLAGLIDAVERYDPVRGVKFESFAGLRIRGAIFDALRALDWVPRAVRTEGRDIERANAALLVRLQRLPTAEELADELGLDAGALAAGLDRIARSHMVALDEPWHAGGGGSEASAVTLGESLADPSAPDPAASTGDAELQDRVEDAVAQLTGREQTILALRHHQNLSYGEIGEVLSVTESRISQIHAKSLLQLRALLDQDELR
jgi:RNA polymerase sigma factor for flagellar operon FliA